MKTITEYILESSVRNRTGYVDAVNTMATEAIEMFGLDDDNVYNLCVNGIDDFSKIMSLMNFYVYKECDNVTSQEKFLTLYKDTRANYVEEITKFLENYQDILTDEEMEDVTDDIDVHSIIDKKYLGGGGYEAKVDFVRACFYKIIEIIKSNHQK